MGGGELGSGFDGFSLEDRKSIGYLGKEMASAFPSKSPNHIVLGLH
jgi:hypothetical protein